MSNRVALSLAALAVGMVIADQALNDGTAGLFLMRKFVDLLEYLSFWR